MATRNASAFPGATSFLEEISVAYGGTGRSTGTTAYALVATGTTATGAQQTLAAGATTEVLVGGGASALPVWTTATGSGSPVRATSPTLVTPVLGVATATSIQAIIGNVTPAAGAFTEASLAAISQSLHIGAVVKAIVYDTSKDSDGGAWRKRCSDKSWYTETLGGSRWIGQAATISAAWTAAGSATGAVFQASATAGPITSGKYYSADSNTTATEVFRGISREFPAVAGIVAETGRVVIYDLSAAEAPLWAVFSATANYALNSGTITSVAALNGRVVVGMSTQEIELGFVADASYKRNATNYTINRLPLGSRNTAGTFNVINTTGIIVNAAVNDVAITVLDTAPTDPATGLPTPCIAVATAGGVSVILDSGTVRNSLSTTASYGISFDDLKRVVWNTTTEVNCSPVPPLAANFTDSVAAQDIKLSSSAYSTSNVSIMPAVTTATGKTAKNAVGSSAGLTVYKAGQTAPSVMLAAITATTSTESGYNTGFMVGDIRLATLADSTAETVTASGELVLIPDFASDASWTKGATWAIGGGVATNTPASATNLSQVITTVAGKTYSFTWTHTRSAGTLTVQAVGATVATLTTSATTTVNFTATATTTTISFNASADFAGTVDDVTVKLATPDRSVKAKGLVINGTLTKTAVASGASLVAYSGFSTANYFEQPYNSYLDFGTGDFCLMGWAKVSSLVGNQRLFQRVNPAATTAMFTNAYIDATGAVIFTTNPAAFAPISISSGAVISANNYACIACVRRSGVLELYINGSSAATPVASTHSLSSAAAVLRLGVDTTGSNPATYASMALWRISATAPSADQIAHIYRTELPLFQANAKCILDGTSTAVTALAYDDTTDLLHVATSYGRSTFKDLLRVDTDVTTTGALTSLSASQGVIITGGTSGKVYFPAMLLRDELRRKDEAKKALGRVVVGKNFTATSGQTAFICTAGYDVRFVYINGLLKTLTTDYTVATDGFQYTVTTTSGVPINQIVTVMLTRS